MGHSVSYLAAEASRVSPVSHPEFSDARKNRDGRDVIGLAEAPERRRRDHFFLEVGADDAHGVDALGLDSARVDGIDPDLSGTQLFRQYGCDRVHRAPSWPSKPTKWAA